MALQVKEVTSEPISKQELERKLVEEHEKSLSDVETKDDITDENQGERQDERQEELSEAEILSYIKEKYGKEVSDLSQFVNRDADEPKLPEDVSAFLKFKKETGRSISEFLFVNKDFDNESPESLVRSYLKETNKGLDDEDIEILYDESFGFDEEDDDDKVVRQRKLAFKQTLAKAKEHFTNLQEKYKVPLESSQSLSNEDDEEYQRYRQLVKEAETAEAEGRKRAEYFKQRMDELFSDEFKGFEFKLDDDTSFVYKPDDAAKLKQAHETPMNFINKFLDENGLIKDSVGYHRALAAAMDPVRMAKFFYEQGKADMAEKLSKDSKNLDLERTSPQVIKTKGGLRIQAVNPESGNGLKIRQTKT
jgi:hypothetical protein